MKHFTKKIAQKTKAESPPENFIIIYTVKIQNPNRVKKVHMREILSAIRRGRTRLSMHPSALPPSRVERGRRLKTDSARDIAEKR